MERRLGELRGVRGVDANPVTGNALIHFDPDVVDEGELVLAAAAAVRAANRVREAPVRAVDGAAETSGEHSREPSGARAFSETSGPIRRARIPVRGLERDGALAARVTSALRKRPGVHTVRANPLTGRILVEFEDQIVQLSDLVADVAGLELPPLPGEDRPSHPLDPAPLVQGSVRAVGSATGLAVLALKRVAGRSGPAIGGATGVAAALGIVDGMPPLRTGLRDIAGEDRAELVFGVLSAVSLTLAGSPLGLAVTGVSAWRLASEVRARRAAFREYEQRLSDAAVAEPGDRVTLHDRERAPLAGRIVEGSGTMIDRNGGPKSIGPGDLVAAGARLAGGPFIIDLQPDPSWGPQPRPGGPPPDVGDGYLRAAGPAGLAYAGLTLLFTRSPSRAISALLLVNARAALIGRDTADTEASARVLRAGVTVVGTKPGFCVRRPAVILFDGPRALCDGLEIGDVQVSRQGFSTDDVLRLASGVAAASGSPWGPAFPAAGRADADEGSLAADAAVARIDGQRYRLAQTEDPGGNREPGCHWLRLECDGEVIGLIGIRPRLASGLRELRESCKRHVVAMAIVGEHDPMGLALAERIDIPLLAVDALQGVRSCQAAGAVTALASDSAHAAAALHAADIGIGLTSGRSGLFLAPADLLAADLSGVAAIVDAGARRDAAVREAVLLSVASNVAGALWGVRRAPSVSRAAQVTYVAALAAMAETWRRLRGGRRSGSLARRLVDPRPERWGGRPIDEVMEELGAQWGGLSTREASRRRVNPPGAVQHNPVLGAIGDQLRSPLNGVLLTAAGLSFALGAFADVAMITAVIAVNAAVGSWQERQAGRATEELEQRGAAAAMVVRDDEPTVVSAADVVPGDILLLKSGDRIAADARLIEAHGLEVDEAALTGESLPVPKALDGPLPGDRVVLEGSDVTVGTGRAVVVAVGEKTRMGATAAAVALDIDAQSPLGTRVNAILRQGLPIVVGGGAAVAIAGVLWGQPLVPQLALGASIAIAAVPEGLPLLTGVAQAAVARRLARRNALVRRLSAVEALGRVDIACTDKTGTLTEGRLRVSSVADLSSAATLSAAMPEHLLDTLLAAALASPHPESLDAGAHSTDAAVIAAAQDAGLGARISAPRQAEIAFDSERSFHTAVVDGRLIVKGAPETLIDRCSRFGRGSNRPLGEDGRARIEERVEALSGEGLRVLMVAQGPADADLEDPRDLTALGFIGISDPIRASVPDAVRRCQEAGVRVVMLTGDHPATARAIARAAGLANGEDAILTGAELAELDDATLDRRLQDATVIARITPLDKLRIVERLQARGHTVAMTGDGINDAPALRLADVGVAIGTHATEVARQAADVVITDDDFGTLAEALVEGRAFWLNIRRALGLLLGGNLGEMGLMVGASVIGHTAPMSTRQILTVNLFSDVLPAVAVAIQPPEHRELSALAREGASGIDARLPVDIVRRGIATALPAFVAYVAASRVMSPVQAQTVAFASIVSTQLAQTWDLGRSEGTLSRPVLGAVLGTGGLVAAAIALPPFNAFLGFALPSPLGLLLIAAASAAAVPLGRMHPYQSGVHRIAALLPQANLGGAR